MIDLMAAGHIMPTLPRPTNVGNDYDAPKEMTLQETISELTALARKMRRAVINPDTNEFREGMPLREVKEAMLASTTLLGTIARNEKVLAASLNFSILRSAIEDTLEELEAEGKGLFIEKFRSNVRRMVEAA